MGKIIRLRQKHDPRRVKKKRRIAFRYFKKKWSSYSIQDAEDFASYYIISLLKHGSDARSLKYYAIDFLRTYTVMYGHYKRAHKEQFRVELPPQLEKGEDSKDLSYFVNSEGIRKKDLPRHMRVAAILYYEWGFELEEIADLFRIGKTTAHRWVHEFLHRDKEDGIR